MPARRATTAVFLLEACNAAGTSPPRPFQSMGEQQSELLISAFGSSLRAHIAFVVAMALLHYVLLFRLSIARPGNTPILHVSAMIALSPDESGSYSQIL